jgi:hypothetical protein
LSPLPPPLFITSQRLSTPAFGRSSGIFLFRRAKASLSRISFLPAYIFTIFVSAKKNDPIRKNQQKSRSEDQTKIHEKPKEPDPEKPNDPNILKNRKDPNREKPNTSNSVEQTTSSI